MLDEYDTLCDLTHPEKKGTEDASAVTNGSPPAEASAGLREAS